MKRIIIITLKYSLYFVTSVMLALIIRLFLCNFYVVPSYSMEPTILPGDFILTEKVSYGARIITGLKFDRNSDPTMIRIPGVRKMRRNDVVVFNSPYRYEWDSIRMNLEQIFVKRCIGIPGDSLSIVGGYYRIAGFNDTLGYIAEQKRLSRFYHSIDSINMRTFPFDNTINWNIINFGPLYVPAVGTTIELTPKNFKLYRQLIIFETGDVVWHDDSLVYINDTVRHYYTFRSNWYFFAGDNVLNSQDSRYFGLIPEDYIIGRASIVLTSKERYSNKRRWYRFMKRIK